MWIVCVKYFRDKTTAEKYEEQTEVFPGTLIQCDKKIAKERIERGFCLEVLNPEILVPKIETVENTAENTEPAENTAENTEPAENTAENTEDVVKKTKTKKAE